jgi:hypothetical protein
MNVWWALLFDVSLWLNGGIIQYQPLDAVMFEEPLAVSIGMEFGVGPAYVYGSVGTDMFALEITSMSQFMNTYTVGLAIELGPFTWGFEHSCYHPAVPYQWVPARQNVVPAFEGSMDRLYIKVRLEGGRR